MSSGLFVAGLPFDLEHLDRLGHRVLLAAGHAVQRERAVRRAEHRSYPVADLLELQLRLLGVVRRRRKLADERERGGALAVQKWVGRLDRVELRQPLDRLGQVGRRGAPIASIGFDAGAQRQRALHLARVGRRRVRTREQLERARQAGAAAGSWLFCSRTMPRVL